MKLIVIQALQAELVELPDLGCDVVRIFSGCGKVAAATALLREIMTSRPDAVINVGTAGTSSGQVGDIVLCNRFVDRDLRPLAIEGVRSEVITSVDTPIFKNLIGMATLETCSTGDSFVTTSFSDGVVCDMEAFAEACVCADAGIPFLAVKYVTDVVGQNSIACWEDKLADASQTLHGLLSHLRL